MEKDHTDPSVCKGCAWLLEPSEPQYQNAEIKSCCNPECDRTSTDDPAFWRSPYAEVTQ